MRSSRRPRAGQKRSDAPGCAYGGGLFLKDGILLLDKPSGPTSHAALGAARSWARPLRVGHAGTLDPLATGLLPALVGRATRLLRFLQIDPKVYRAVLRFGVTTDTADADGRVVSVCDSGQRAPSNWEDLLAAHTGTVELPVPLYSAIKVDGRPLHRYTRSGVSVEPPQRLMSVSSLHADASGWPWVQLEVECATGTYVRSLAASLGDATDVGAHVVSLRRLRVGAWDVERAVRAPDLAAGQIPEGAYIPLDEVLTLNRLVIEMDDAAWIAAGRVPRRVVAESAAALSAGEPFAFTDTEGRLLAVARARASWTPSHEPPRFDFERVVVDRA